MEWIQKMNYLADKGIAFLFILDFDLKAPFIKVLENIHSDEILYFLNGTSNVDNTFSSTSSPDLYPEPPEYELFLKKFNIIQSEIQAGNTYLLNLSFKTPVRLNMTLRDIFFRSRSKYKLWIKNKFVLFSPESFIKTKGRTISTFPMKGTAEKKNNNSVSDLLGDKKEAAEHATITDLLRNDLAKVAESIRVKRYRYVDEISTGNKTILQVSSEITGHLQEKFMNRPGDLFYELLPAGSVTGAPKKKTVEIIKSVENYNRGYYTGVFGIFNGKDIDSAVMIRFIENIDGSYFYKSGGGITFMSEARKEYEEIIQKIYVPVH